MHDLYLLVTVMGLVVAVLVEGALVYALIKFRKKSDELPSQMHGNNVVEVIWTAIPILIVVTLFGFAFRVLTQVEHDHETEDLTVEVQGFQFQWQFTYCLNDLGSGSDAPLKGDDAAYKGPCATAADEIIVIGKAGEENEPTLVIPVGQRVEFKLKSTDVIHSFYIRDFLYKLDVIPGRDNSFVVNPLVEEAGGSFFGQCAELCGIDHSLMRFKVELKTRAEFDKWIAERAEGAKATRQP